MINYNCTDFRKSVTARRIIKKYIIRHKKNIEIDIFDYYDTGK
jgi:hypothetical protein